MGDLKLALKVAVILWSHVHMITTQALGKWLTITTVTLQHGHLIAICDLPSWLARSKVNMEAHRRLPVTPGPAIFSPNESLGGMGILYSIVPTCSHYMVSVNGNCLLILLVPTHSYSIVSTHGTCTLTPPCSPACLGWSFSGISKFSCISTSLSTSQSCEILA